MAIVAELINTEENGTISFGNYQLEKKTKLENFEYQGDIYKVKTYNKITRLEKNGYLVYESVPGTAVASFTYNEQGVEFLVEGNNDAQITLELESETAYQVCVGDNVIGEFNTNVGGKLTFSVELQEEEKVYVEIKKA